MVSIETHRLAKLFIDSGEAKSEQEALNILNSLSITILTGPEVRHSRNLQVSLLTLVCAGTRTFLGGVRLVGVSDCPLLVDIAPTQSLHFAVRQFGAAIVNEPLSGSALLLLGSCQVPPGWQGLVLRITWQRWCASVGPTDIERLAEDDEFAPAAVYAASVALSETFQHLLKRNPMAGRRQWCVSLFRPDFVDNPLAMQGPDDPLLLPSELWIIGLGHLGQAYLWNLLMLRYPPATKAHLVLQDIDLISEATLSTGILASRKDLGQLKTRRMSKIMERAGFITSIIERRFDGTMKLQNSEPRRALSALDNSYDRVLLEDVGFQEVIDAGLGASGDHYLSYTLRVFPSIAGNSNAKKIFSSTAKRNVEALLDAPAYQALLSDHNRCGVLEIAEKAVGAPFVGAAVGSLVIAEAVRSTMNGPRYNGLSGSLRAQDGFRAEWKGPTVTFENLGFIPSIADHLEGK